MRVTEKILYDSIRSSVMENRDRLFSTQKKIASNRKLTTLSDDPRGSEKASRLKSMRAELDQARRNIRFGKTSLEVADAALQGVEDLLARAREIAVQFASGEYGDRDRDLAAMEVGEIQRQLVVYANAKNGAEYVFSGFRSDTPAYSADGVWQGDDGKREIGIGMGERVATNVAGSAVFGSSAPVGAVPAGGVMMVLRDLRSSLENDDADGIRNALSAVDAGMDTVLSNRALVGARIRKMEMTETAIQNMIASMENQLAGIEDLDIAEAATELSKQEAILQAAVQVAGRIGSLSILDALKG